MGAGRAFSSGVDLDALAAADTVEYADALAVLLPALTELPKPLLAGVHGAAVGFGSTILLHADVVVVADDARLRLPFAQFGTVPEAASSLSMTFGPLTRDGREPSPTRRSPETSSTVTPRSANHATARCNMPTG